MDRYTIRLHPPTGDAWNLTAPTWLAGLRAGGIEGLVGVPTDVALVAPGWPGQILDSWQVPKLQGALRLAVRGGGGESADDVWARLRSAFRPGVVSRLEIKGTSWGRLTAAIRRDGEISPPRVDPAAEEVILDVDVPVAGDSGVWETDVMSGAGQVVVANEGDVLLWPSISWTGAGGTVTMPSGATFELPGAVAGRRRLHLSPQHSMVVVDTAGVEDTVLWQAVRGSVLPEPVPAGEERTYEVPSGATLEWKMGVLDPWS